MTFSLKALRRRFDFAVFLAILLLMAACGPAMPEQVTQTSDEPDSDVESAQLAELLSEAEEVLNSSGESADIAGASDAEAISDISEAESDQVESRSEPAGGIDASPAQEDMIDGIAVGFTGDGHPYLGNPHADIVIKEYSDFQCPFCARFFSQSLPVLKGNQIANGDVVLIYYDFPLSNLHPQAFAAANAARCAGEQGAAAFWAMHDALFTNTQAWSVKEPEDAFSNLASGIGLEVESFESCVSANKYQSEIQSDLNAGSALGITGTPSFLLNEQLLVGAQPIDVFNNAIATIQSGGQLASNEPRPSQQPAQAPTPAAFSDNRAATLGDPDAPVTIVEFADYQCPACSYHSLETLPTIISEMVDEGRVHYVLKDFPLDRPHPNARAAAGAVRCAGEQDAYWEMHDVVYANQADWSEANASLNDSFASFAADIGLDIDDFEACLASGRFDAAIQASVEEASALGVPSTPYFFINGYPLDGARPFEHFEIAVGLAEEGRLAEIYAPPPDEPTQPTGPVDVPIDNAYSIGDPAAPITIVEFTDFQCPFCGRHFNQTYPQIVEKYVKVGTVFYVFKDFPLNSIHPQAAKAAEAARCAGDQGAYLELHDLLFARQAQWSGREPDELFIGYAKELGLDGELFAGCLDSGQHAAAIEADLQDGLALGVNGTPAFFINGHLVSGAQPFDLFEQAITTLLAVEEAQQ
jgi:protein-disulfide isomerase